MAHAEWDLWGRLEKIVQDGSYMSANEEFTALKGLVQRADASELSAQLARAPLAWEFLLTFGAKKPFYRSHLCQVVEALLAQPRWREVYASSQELQEKAADPALHADIKKALAAVPAAPASVAASKKAEKPRSGGPSKDVEWPSWEVLQEVVQKETFMAANEEFRVLRLAVLAADPVQLASQVAHAPMVWEFIAGFAAKKSHFRSQVVEVTSALRKERGWDEALEAAQPSLRSRINELPEAASAVRGQLSRADQSPAASGGDSSLGDVGEEEHQTPYTSPDFQSLEERLRSMMSCVANLAPDQSPSVDEGEDPQTAAAAAAAGSSEGLREEMVSQLLDEARASGYEDARPPQAPDPRPPQPPQLPQQEPPKKEPQAEVAPEALCLLDRAAALEADGSQPVAAHYLRIHALEMLLAAKQRGPTNAESDKLLFATFEKAEEAKAKLDLSTGAEQLRHFAVQNYEQAVSADGGPADAKHARDLLTAGLCLDALAQFGAVEPALKERAQYAKSRAEHLRSCLLLQRAPEAPQPPQQPAAPAAPAVPPVVPPPPPRAPAAPAAPDPPTAPTAPSAAPKAQPKPSAPPPSRPTAVVPQAQPAPAAAGTTLSASKRQVEARKKADQAIAAVAAGSDDSARALIREAIGLLQGL